MSSQWHRIKSVVILLNFLSVASSMAMENNKCLKSYKALKQNESFDPKNLVEEIESVNPETVDLLSKISKNSRVFSNQLNAIQQESKSVPLERLHRPKSGYTYHSLIRGSSNLEELNFLNDSKLHFESMRKARNKSVVVDFNTGMKFATEIVPMKPLIEKWNLPLLPNRSKDPRLQPIAEMRIASYKSDGYDMLVKPNFYLLNKKMKLNLPDFFIGPIEVAVHLDGTLGESRKSFPLENHPLNVFNPEYYRYYFEPLADKKLNRFILTQKTLDSDPSQQGLADVFFKSHQGQELKSLAQVSGLRFNRILPITEQLYLTEVFDVKTNSSKIQILEYEPQRQTFEVFADYAKDKNISNILSSLFTPFNPHGLFDLKFNPLVFDQVKDAVQITAKDKILNLYRGTDNYEKLNLEGRAVSGPGFQKYIETRPLKSQAESSYFYSIFDSRSERTNNGFYTGIKDVSSSYVRRSGKDLAMIQEWSIPGTSLSQYVYGVDNGFVVQREGLNEQKVLQHEILFLSDSGEFKVIGDASSNLGAMTVYDGHIFFFGPNGENLNIWKLDELL